MKRWDLVMDVNLRAPLLAMKAALPGMIARRRGAILNVSSAAAVMPIPGLLVYGVSKAALERLTMGAARGAARAWRRRQLLAHRHPARLRGLRLQRARARQVRLGADRGRSRRRHLDARPAADVQRAGQEPHRAPARARRGAEPRRALSVAARNAGRARDGAASGHPAASLQPAQRARLGSGRSRRPAGRSAAGWHRRVTRVLQLLPIAEMGTYETSPYGALSAFALDPALSRSGRGRGLRRGGWRRCALARRTARARRGARRARGSPTCTSGTRRARRSRPRSRATR